MLIAEFKYLESIFYFIRGNMCYNEKNKINKTSYFNYNGFLKY